MGLRDDIQADLAEAFDDDLADAVQAFTGSYTGPGVWDPVSETTTAQPVAYTGRGVFDSYDSRRIDNINILVGDVLLICLASEITDKPAVGHEITADDLITGEPVKYRIVSPGIDSAKAHYEIQLRK
ncbi:glutamate 5-kinase [Pseudomonas sp. TYF_15]|uniref:glutamate 5-kinase n=1 Tax=Pseudomonas TaxID=286 RepID=UPI0013E05D73|nr:MULTISPECIES: glutamate 5-kinase [Pseudomonas]MCE0912065.1 glutamate 5-kinase [Pseudomonas kurunegalensis]QIG17855.1 glutamate 5-kinase [Pseudomonas monteilii]QIG23112.1 glutamate 5-kinase [Pseudomonas monteilii]WJR57602.1 glutamate 5-kinase [Pseudomonas kurunegalensis]